MEWKLCHRFALTSNKGLDKQSVRTQVIGSDRIKKAQKLRTDRIHTPCYPLTPVKCSLVSTTIQNGFTLLRLMCHSVAGHIACLPLADASNNDYYLKAS